MTVGWRVVLHRGRWGDPVAEVSAGTFRGVVRLNDVGEGDLETPFAGCEPRLDETQAHVVESISVWQGDQLVWAGFDGETKVTGPRGDRRLAARFQHAWGLLQLRWVWPDPRIGPPHTGVYRRSGPAATVAADLITANLGAGALDERRVEWIAATISSTGVEVGEWEFEYEPLGDAVRRVAGGDCVVRADVDPDAPLAVFRCGLPVVRDGLLVTDNGDVQSSEIVRSPASASWVLGLGDDFEGAGRAAAVRKRAVRNASYRREFVNDGSGDHASVATEAAQALAEGSREWSAAVEVTTDVAERLRFGVDYQVGDLIPVDVAGQGLELPVEAVRVEWSAAGQRCHPVLGRATDNEVVRLIRSVRGLERRSRRVGVTGPQSSGGAAGGGRGPEGPRGPRGLQGLEGPEGPPGDLDAALPPGDTGQYPTPDGAGAYVWRTTARRDVSDFGVVGSGDEAVALQAAFDAGVPLIVPAGMTISVGSQIVLPSGLDLVLDGRIERTWGDGFGTFSGAMFVAGVDLAGRASNITIAGTGSVGAQSPTVGGGDILHLYCDDLRLRGLTVDGFWDGRAIYGGGHRWQAEGVRTLNPSSPGSGAGCGGFRFIGGDDFHATGCHIDSLDDTLQFVPNEDGPTLPIRRGAYVNCSGSSGFARFMVVINGGDSTPDIEDVQFIGCNGTESGPTSGARAIQVSINDTSAGNIRNVTFSDCSIDMSGSTGSAVGAIMVSRGAGPTGVIDGVRFKNVRVIAPPQEALNLIANTVGGNKNVSFEDCDFGTPQASLQAAVVTTSIENYRFARCRFGSAGAENVRIGGSGSPSNVVFEDCDIEDVATRGIVVAGGSGVKVRRCRFESTGSPTSGVQIQAGATPETCEVTDNDFSALGASTPVEIPNGQRATTGNNKGVPNVNEQTSSPYTIQAEDCRRVIVLNNAGASTLNFATDAFQSIPVGEWVDLFGQGAGTWTFAGGTTRHGATSIAQGQRLRATKTAADTWVIG